LLRKFFRKRNPFDPRLPAGDKAARLFDRGLNCAQAVFQATSGSDDPRMMKICEAYGSGLGGAKCLCGAVNGGVMVLGLAGRGSLAGQLIELFKARHKTTCCKGLSAPFVWGSREHFANCRQITASTAILVETLLK